MLRFPRLFPALAAASLLSACASGAFQATPAASNLPDPSTVAAATPRKLPAVPPLDTAEAESPLLQLGLVGPRERPTHLTSEAPLPEISVADAAEPTDDAASETEVKLTLDGASVARDTPAEVEQARSLPEVPVADETASETQVTPMLDAASVTPRNAPVEIAQAKVLPEVVLPEAIVAANEAADPGILGSTAVAFAETLPGYVAGAPRGLRLIDRRIPADADAALAQATVPIPSDAPVAQVAAAAPETRPAEAAPSPEPLSLATAIAQLENPIPEMEPIPDDPAPRKVASAEGFKGSPRPRPLVAQGGPEVPLVFELRR